MSPNLFLIAAIMVAILNEIAVARNLRRAEYVFKPGVMVLLLAWLWAIGGFSGTMLWFCLGITFALAGDVFLMLPREKFIAGLIAFLLTHVAYTVGLKPIQSIFNLSALILLLVVATSAWMIYRRIANGLQARGNSRLKVPVFIYVIAISLMVFSALLSLVNDEWLPLPAFLVSSGALLFMLSDTILALNKFVAPIRNGGVINLATYHAGQILILLGAALHYL